MGSYWFKKHKIRWSPVPNHFYGNFLWSLSGNHPEEEVKKNWWSFLQKFHGPFQKQFQIFWVFLFLGARRQQSEVAALGDDCERIFSSRFCCWLCLEYVRGRLSACLRFFYGDESGCERLFGGSGSGSSRRCDGWRNRVTWLWFHPICPREETTMGRDVRSISIQHAWIGKWCSGSHLEELETFHCQLRHDHGSRGCG